MDPNARTELARAAGAAVVAEIAYTTRDGGVDAAVVSPLVDDGVVVLALPYAERALADALADADEVVLVTSDERLALRGWRPLAAAGVVEVEADPEGTRFREGLVEAEVRKHPPSRLLANSLMDRREHWWFMSRLLCRLVGVRDVWEVGARGDPRQGLLAWWAAEGLRADTVAAEPLGTTDLRVRSLAGGLLADGTAPACLLRHDFSIPDLERRTKLVERGRLEGDALRVSDRQGQLALPPPPGLVERVRRQRALAKACRRELARTR